MFKVAAFATILLASAVLAGISAGQAQTVERRMLDGSRQWKQVWGFAGPDVYRESHPSKRKRLAGLYHMAHVHAVQACDEIEIVQENVAQLFANDGFGPLSPRELAFVGGLISDFKTRLKAQVGEEVCEWGYENYGPNGAMYPGLIRSKPVRPRGPDAASSLPPPKLPEQASLPSRQPPNL